LPCIAEQALVRLGRLTELLREEEVKVYRLGVLLARLLGLDGKVHARARIDPQDPLAGLGREPFRERKPRRALEHDPDLRADGVTASYRRLSFPRCR
jgi:hypothetical protein